LSSPRSHDEDCLIVSPVLNHFQVLKDLRENYPCSDGELSCCDQPLSPSMVPESSLEMVTPIHSSYQKNPKELSVYTPRKKHGKYLAEAEFGLVAPILEVPRGLSLFLTNLSQCRQVVLKIWEKDLNECRITSWSFVRR